MKNYFLLNSLIILLFLLSNCRKKVPLLNQITETPQSISDGALQITKITKSDLNEGDIQYQINPESKIINDIFIQWSIKSDYSQFDSLLLHSTINQPTIATFKLARLAQNKDYYIRLCTKLNGKMYYSNSSNFKTDSLVLIDFPKEIVKNEYNIIFTNFNSIYNPNDTLTHIYFNNVECNVINSDGKLTTIKPQISFNPGKYEFKFARKGIYTIAKDSIEILPGSWSRITSPIFPLAPGYSDNSLIHYGSTFSSTTGYILPGTYYRHIPYGLPGHLRPGYVLTFNPLGNSWNQITPTNPMYFENPISYYHQNSIYVIGGRKTDEYNSNTEHIKNVYKLDLLNLTWKTIDSVPYKTNFNLVSFSYQNEFYIGMGVTTDTLTSCCGEATPSNKFWKYNPTTNQWNRLSDIPRQHEFNQVSPTAFVIGNKAYFFYGAIPHGSLMYPSFYTQELWEYSIDNNTWLKKSLPTNLPIPFGDKYLVFVYDKKAYFLNSYIKDIGVGFYYFTINNPGLEYDPVSNKFKKIAPLTELGMAQLFYQNGKKFYFHADAAGYGGSSINMTKMFEIE